MAAAAPPTQLCARYRNHFHSRLTQHCIGVSVAFVCHHHAGGESEQVIAVVPLLTLSLIDVTTGNHRAQLTHSDRFSDYIQK